MLSQRIMPHSVQLRIRFAMKNTHNSQERLAYLKQQLSLEISRAVAATLKEDLGGTLAPAADITASLIPADAQNEATIITREHGVFCGQAWADEVFKQLADQENGSAVKIEWHVKDGDKVEPNQVLCTLSGSSRMLLTGERNAMNFIQTLSGCATTVAEYAEKLAGTDCRLLDTRKTVPGLRSALKYAVACGGGFNHRIGAVRNDDEALGHVTAVVRDQGTVGIGHLERVDHHERPHLHIQAGPRHDQHLGQVGVSKLQSTV